MNSLEYYQFLSGSVMMGCLVAAVFFFRFRAKTGDVFFALFGWAFLLFALERLLLALVHARAPEQYPLIYVARLIGFGLILFAIYWKNKGRGQAGPD